LVLETWILRAPSWFGGTARITLKFLNLNLNRASAGFNTDVRGSLTISALSPQNANPNFQHCIITGGNWSGVAQDVLVGDTLCSSSSCLSTLGFSYMKSLRNISLVVVSNEGMSVQLKLPASLSPAGYGFVAQYTMEAPQVTAFVLNQTLATAATLEMYLISGLKPKTILANPAWLPNSAVFISYQVVYPSPDMSKWLTVSYSDTTGVLSLSGTPQPGDATLSTPVAVIVKGTNAYGLSANWTLFVPVVTLVMPDTSSTLSCAAPSGTPAISAASFAPPGVVVVNSSTVLTCTVTGRRNGTVVAATSQNFFTLVADSGSFVAPSKDGLNPFRSSFDWQYTPSSNGADVQVKLSVNGQEGANVTIYALVTPDNTSALTCSPKVVFVNTRVVTLDSPNATVTCTVQAKRAGQVAFAVWPFALPNSNYPACFGVAQPCLADSSNAGNVSFGGVSPVFAQVFSFPAYIRPYVNDYRIVSASALMYTVTVSSLVPDATSAMLCGIQVHACGLRSSSMADLSPF
jgi:hypothetical protein